MKLDSGLKDLATKQIELTKNPFLNGIDLNGEMPFSFYFMSPGCLKFQWDSSFCNFCSVIS